MGEVVLVPPPFMFERLQKDGSNAYGLNLPVQGFAVNSNGLHPDGMHVQIPSQNWITEYYDPLMAFSSYYGLGGASFDPTSSHYSGLRSSSGRTRQASRRKTNASSMFHSVNSDMIQHSFWDFRDIEEFAAGLKGKLFVQIDTANGRWNFGCSDTEDGFIVQERINKPKTHCFTGMKAGLKEDIEAWLNEHAAEFDLFVNSFGDPNLAVTVYVRDDVHAVHFKLRWYGADD